jgi:hypothetical protein
VPTILRGFAQKVLTAGKYLSVVRDCAAGNVTISTAAVGPTVDASKKANDNGDGSSHKGAGPSVVLPSVRKLELSLEVADSPLARSIQEAYYLSSRALLKILDHKGLRSHLRSLRRFFLLEHGDFFTQFMDTAEEELRREAKEVALVRVQALLQMAVQTSTLLSDPHREELSCTLASHNLIQHLHLIQVFIS